MVDRLGGTSPGVSTQAVLLKLLNISAVGLRRTTARRDSQRRRQRHLGALRKGRNLVVSCEGC